MPGWKTPQSCLQILQKNLPPWRSMLNHEKLFTTGLPSDVVMLMDNLKKKGVAHRRCPVCSILNIRHPVASPTIILPHLSLKMIEVL